MMKRLPILFLGLAILATQIAVAQENPPRYVNIFTAHTKLGHQAAVIIAESSVWACKLAGVGQPQKARHQRLLWVINRPLP